MSLGDAVSEDQIKKSNTDRMKADLFPQDEKPSKQVKVVEDSYKYSESVESGDNFVDKYKNKNAIGSDDIGNGSSSYKKDLTQFEGKSGFGSDDLSGKTSSTASQNSKFYSDFRLQLWGEDHGRKGEDSGEGERLV
jgi:hypothetical protein